MIVLSIPLTEWFLWRWYRLSVSRLLVRPVAALAACTLIGAGARTLWPGAGIVVAAASAVALVALYLGASLLVDRELVEDVRWLYEHARSRAGGE
jgi:hypothetical protein